MNDRHDLPERFRELLDQYCTDAIDEEGLREFETYLRRDEAARREFAAYFHLQTELESILRAARTTDPAPGAPRDPLRRRWTGHRGWWAAALAAAVFLGGLTLLVRTSGHRAARVAATADAKAMGPASAGAATPRPKVGVASGLAMVVKLEGVRWEPTDGPPPLEGDLLAAGHLRIRSGRATLAMFTGVTLVLEGPADLELVSSDKVVCHRGKLRTRVPHEAEGFVISGPGSAVVDLGTEFGMNVDRNGRTRGKVFEGLVEAALLDEAGSYRRSRLMNQKSNAFEIDPRAGRIGADVGREDFVSPTRPSVRPLLLDERYRDAILRSAPWCYWRFESLADGLISNEVPGRPPLRASGPIRLSGPAQGNKSAVFAASQPDQCLTLDGTWEPPRRPGYAIELWFLPETIGHLTLASMLADDPRASPVEKPADLHFKFLLELTSRTRRQLLHRPASVRLLHRFPPGWYHSSDNLYSGECYVPYRWHHLVGQMNGDRMELFLDGQPTPPLAVDPVFTNAPCQLLLGRLTTIPLDHEDTSRPFVGLMDEVALYDHPLTSEEIRQHHRLADPGSRTE